MEVKTLILTAGHLGYKTGAWSQWFDEGRETIRLRNSISNSLRKKGFRVSNDSDHQRLGNIIRWVNEQHDENDLLIEFHFNAVDNRFVSGTEAFVQLNATDFEKETAAALCAVTSRVLGIPDRGVKTPSFSQHKTLGILDRTKVQSVLFEVCFLSNPEEIKIYQANYKKLVSELSKAIVDIAL